MYVKILQLIYVKNFRQGQHSNPDFQLYALARFGLRHPDESLDQAGTFFFPQLKHVSK